MTILNSAAYSIQFTTQKVMRIETGPLMCRCKTHISLSTKYRQPRAILYTDPLYVKVPSLLGNKPAQVFTSREFILVAPMKSKEHGRIVLMDICDEYRIKAELRYNNYKDGSMPGTMVQRITRNFYIIGKSSETYT